MSLRPEDHRSSRSLSHSHSKRDRSRSRSHVRNSSTSNIKPPSNIGSEEKRKQLLPENYGSSIPRHLSPVAMPSMPSMPDEFDDYHAPPLPRRPTIESRRSTTDSGAAMSLPYPVESNLTYYPTETSEFTMGDYKDLPPHERPGYIAKSVVGLIKGKRDDDADLAYGNLPLPRERDGLSSPRAASPAGYASNAYQYPTTATGARQDVQHGMSNVYGQPPGQQYGQQYDKGPYNARSDQASANYTYSTEPYQSGPSKGSQFNARVMDVTPGISKQANLGLVPRMERLSVSGNRPDLPGGIPPPSPLLEAYRGTYQSVSPMIAPMRLSSDGDLDKLSSLSPAPSSSNRTRHKRSKSSTGSRDDTQRARSDTLQKESKKRVRLYDAEKDALAINEAISHHKIDADKICDVLPSLTHDQMLELRKEYKKQVKVQGRGINMAKHVKMKLSGNFGKVAYVCALGRFESEGYWSNFWYQSHSSRRELLIESLMGRSNADINQIKDTFKDKRYSDDLVRCMEKELKPDKFRVAVLIALEARRQEEHEVYAREYIEKDVTILNRCLVAREGGESAMLDIIVQRSDAHLREVLRAYELTYGTNFAREALRKSNNLVGEVIAHILNGVINRPARDALLLHHAVDDIRSHNKDEELRYELLISRLVRVHWDQGHLSRVKREYAEKYRTELEHDVEDATRGDFREFVYELSKA